jgi:putative FmdB family regulatory protein
VPRYDYRCVECDHGFELVQSFSEAGTGTCPECSGAGRRVFHAVPVIYKGSGFYTTDYGRTKPPGENNKGENDSTKNGDGESGKSTAESKPKSETTASSSTSESSSSSSETASTSSSKDSKSGTGDK